MQDLISSLVESWSETEGNISSNDELIDWINELNQVTDVSIKECNINDDTFWFYDDYNGEVLNRKRSFFSIKGMRMFENDQFIQEQPIIFQPEIGYLGIICKYIDGMLNFLMQAKIEPGNINCVQISPTIQATKSNFTRAHGGKLPLYFEYFEQSSKYQVIYDQIQSEQSSRFYKKRNRNMIMIVEEEVPVYQNFRWMTLGQIKRLMEIDNLVNMDTRTVLSGIPLFNLSLKKDKEILEFFDRKALFNSIFDVNPLKTIPVIYQYINNYKMFHDVSTVAVPLNQLVDWHIDEYGITCKKRSNFMVRYYDIQIEGREVKHWNQPLFKALGQAVFGLIFCERNNKIEFLVAAKHEIGCFDKIELAPSIQQEPNHNEYYNNCIETLFYRYLNNKQGIIADVMLSEEGGRFYQEQNRNVIMEIDENDIDILPDGYFWIDYGTLNYLVQVNNCLNIQLRNLLSLLKI